LNKISNINWLAAIQKKLNATPAIRKKRWPGQQPIIRGQDRTFMVEIQGHENDI